MLRQTRDLQECAIIVTEDALGAMTDLCCDVQTWAIRSRVVDAGRRAAA